MSIIYVLCQITKRSHRKNKFTAALRYRCFQRHVDYIHYNPVKHGLVQNVEEWPWSTYHKYVKEGFYGRVNNIEHITKVNTEGFGE